LLRNREIQWLVLTSCVITIVSVIAAYFLTPIAAILILFTSSLLIGCNLIFTRIRYRELEKLSAYLRQISSGNHALDVRDNHEGELSILKNDIYKVTLILSEHSSLLQQDKIRLTDAISDISHQLKTPLTSMMVMADLLSDAQLPDSRRLEFTRNIRIQLERIEWLISSLLKISKIDAGTVAFKKDMVLVKKLVHQALEPVLIPMDIKEQTVSVHGEDTVSFLGDLNWTAEAIINILKNAVEHTPDGGRITISFSENVLYTEIFIEDNGKGIAREDLRYIFKRFYKGKNASEGSIGIGLAMAHSIITSQYGDITVKSVQGEGTQFHIKFYKQII
jgi:signal transduction histidine kinase